MRRTLWLRLAFLVVVSGGLWGGAWARVYMSQEEALKLAFPAPVVVGRQTLYLNDEQAKRISEAAGVPVEVRVVPYYVGRLDGRISGFAYFDTHLVRTLPETILVRLTPEGVLMAIDIVSFDEPEDYKVTPRWLDQFKGLAPEDPRRLGGEIRSLSGATLSARAITEAARRVLALHRTFVQGTASARPPAGHP